MEAIFSIFTLSIFSLLVNAQNSKLLGSWLLAKVEDEIHEPYFITEFNEGGKTAVMGIEPGIWEIKGNKIIMKSEFDGTHTILKLTNNELIVTKEEAKIFYVKVNQEKINNENKESGLVGTWRIKNSQGSTQLLKFELPDVYSYVNASDGMTENSEGTWVYNSSDKSVRTYSIRGNNIINELTDSELVMKNR